IEPYPYTYARTHLAGDLHERYGALEGQEVAVAGRLVGAKRVMGKIGFAHLQDVSGRIQLYLRADAGAEGFALFNEHLDTGACGARGGTARRTTTGDDSCEGRELTLLAKSLAPLPEKWHGLHDVEKRYRQRYLDLIVNPDVQDVFRVRSRALQAIRGFLVAR